MAFDRRAFLEVVGGGVLASSAGPRELSAAPRQGSGAGSHEFREWRASFPALAQVINGHPLAYLDSAATTLRPRPVIDAVTRFSESDNANPGATLHTLARRSAEHYTRARRRVAEFLGAASPSEVVFTRGTTEAINLVAATWGEATLESGTEIVLTRAEHYSNLLPWRRLAERVGARVVVVDVDDEGRLSPARVREVLNSRTRLVAFSHVSNVLGLVNEAADICAVARAKGIATLIDAAQSAPHLPLSVKALGCDFLACSGHKMLGPMGVGVLWSREETLDRMPPYHVGSNMAHDVEESSVQYEHGALKYQAGTPNVSGPVGLAAAIDLLERIGLEGVRRHDSRLVEYARDQFRRLPGLRVLGSLADAPHRVPVFTFTFPDMEIRRTVQALDDVGIAVRAGDMAALPLLKRFGLSSAIRASCYLYTSTAEIDRLVEALARLSRG